MIIFWPISPLILFQFHLLSPFCPPSILSVPTRLLLYSFNSAQQQSGISRQELFCDPELKLYDDDEDNEEDEEDEENDEERKWTTRKRRNSEEAKRKEKEDLFLLQENLLLSSCFLRDSRSFISASSQPVCFPLFFFHPFSSFIFCSPVMVCPAAAIDC